MFFTSNRYKKICKYLDLDKPLVVFDMETTGRSISSDKIIELAYIKIWPDGKIKQDSLYFNPEMSIPEEATAIHGISNVMVAEKPTFKERAQELYDLFSDCYFGGFNILDFDLPILRREFIRVGRDFEYPIERVVDSKKIFACMAPGNLSSAYEYYCHKQFTGREDMTVNTEAAAEILLRQLERYQEARDWNFINRIHSPDEEYQTDNIRKFYWKNGEACFAFSKYRDKPLSEVAREDPRFLEWILTANFTDETKYIVRTALETAAMKGVEGEKEE